MRRWLMGLLVVGMLTGISIGGAWAADTPNPAPNAPNGWTFEDMLPFMKNRHPNVDETVLKDMWNACHVNGIGYGPWNGSGPGMMRGWGVRPN